MGRIASSSKRKSSKKKKSKASSQTRRKKTSKRNKSKRLHSSDDSASSYSDDSLRSLSISSSDSEDDYNSRKGSRKGRSRVRDKIKSGRKRTRRSSSSEDSSVEKRKHSKRNGDSKVSKKTKKKKSRRKPSISPLSSDSQILRTRRHDSSSGTEESENERARGRSRKRENNKRSSGNAKTRSKKSKFRSRSCSSCSRYSDDQSKDKVTSEIDQRKHVVTNEILPRRLRSVITVVQPYHEEEVVGQNKDEHKEEILYDQDDYPSCRSNDSNDGGKRDLVHKSYVESEKERDENMAGEEDFASELVSKESKLSSGDRIDQFAEIKPQSEGASIKCPGNKNDIDINTTTAGPGSEELESILRQKALENLMKFRGPHRNANPLSHHENEDKKNVKSCTAKADDVQNRSFKQELSSGVGEARGRNQNNRRTMRKDSSRFVQIEEMNLDGRDTGIEFNKAKQGVVHPSTGLEISSIPKDNDYTIVQNLDNKSEPNSSSLMEQPLGSNLEQVPPSPVSGKGTLPVDMNAINKSAAETVAGSSGNNQNVGVIDACRVTPESCIKPISEEHNSSQCQDESKGNSQFKEKTMSVMRGGEMVQVSYKVYIPNKAPALARRKLQR